MDSVSKPEIDEIWSWLGEVPDPEIPVISIVDLGIVRRIDWEDDTLVVHVTPTYSGCPATAVINADIEKHLHSKGVMKLQLRRQLSPAWTSDWLTDTGRRKLEDYGIAPPAQDSVTLNASVGVGVGVVRAAPVVKCPRCKSIATEKISQFGSTPCKASYRCQECLEPFDYFKCI